MSLSFCLQHMHEKKFYEDNVSNSFLAKSVISPNSVSAFTVCEKVTKWLKNNKQLNEKQNVDLKDSPSCDNDLVPLNEKTSNPVVLLTPLNLDSPINDLKYIHSTVDQKMLKDSSVLKKSPLKNIYDCNGSLEASCISNTRKRKLHHAKNNCEQKLSSENTEETVITANNHQVTASKQSPIIHQNIKESRKQGHKNHGSKNSNYVPSDPDYCTSSVFLYRKENKSDEWENRSDSSDHSTYINDSDTDFYMFTSKTGDKYIVDWFEYKNIKKMFVHVKLQKRSLDPCDSRDSKSKRLKKVNKRTVSKILDSLGAFDKVNEEIFSANSSRFSESSSSSDDSETDVMVESESGKEPILLDDLVFLKEETPDHNYGLDERNDHISNNQEDTNSSISSNIDTKSLSSFESDYKNCCVHCFQ